MIRSGPIVASLSLALAWGAFAGGGGETPRRNQAAKTPPEPVVPAPVVAPEPVVAAPVVAPEPVVAAPVVAPETVVAAPVVAPEPVVAAPVVAAPEPVAAAPVTPADPAAVRSDNLVQLRGRLELVQNKLVLQELRARPPFREAQRHPIQLVRDDLASVHSAIHATMGLLPEVVVHGTLQGDGGVNRAFQAARVSNPAGDREYAHSGLTGTTIKGKLSDRPRLRVGELNLVHPEPAWEAHLRSRLGQDVSAEGWQLLDSGRPRGIVLTRLDGRPIGEGPPPATAVTQVEPAAPTVLPPGEVAPGTNAGLADVVDSATSGRQQQAEGASSAPATGADPLAPRKVKLERGVLYDLVRELRAQVSPAERAEGKTITTPMLMLANGLRPGERVPAGRELVVPAAARPGALVVKDAEGKPAHWVQEGDSLWALSRRYKTSLSALMEANPALSQRVARVGADRALRAGDVLTLPAGAPLEGATVIEPAQARAAGK